MLIPILASWNACPAGTVIAWRFCNNQLA